MSDAVLAAGSVLLDETTSKKRARTALKFKFYGIVFSFLFGWVPHLRCWGFGNPDHALIVSAKFTGLAISAGLLAAKENGASLQKRRSVDSKTRPGTG